MQDPIPDEDRAFARFRQDRDGTALTEVFDRTAPALLAFARGTIADPHLAEDLVQQTFVVAIEARSDWDGERLLLPWLMGILAHRARNLRRREQRRAHDALDDGELTAPNAADDPHRAAAGREFARAFQDAIDELPEPYGPVIDMHLRHGLTAAEIARSLRRPPGTVRTQIVRGSRLLRSALPQGFAAAGVTLALTDTALAAVRTAIVGHARTVGAIALRPASVGVIGSALTFLLMHKIYFSLAALLVVALSIAIAQPSWTADPAKSPEPTEPRTAAAATPTVTPSDVQVAPVAPVVRTLVQPDVAPAPTAPSNLVVRVLQAWDGAPANLVRVTVRGDTDQTTELSTGDDGTADCGELRDGSIVALPDFDMTETVRTVDGTRSAIEFRVPARLEVAVRVVDADGTAVAGAQLFTYRGLAADIRQIVLGTTDAEGVARLRTAQGFLSVTAGAPGHLPSASKLLLAKRPPRGTVELELGSPARSSRIVVTNFDGKPAAAAIVQVFLPERQRMRPLIAWTASDGTAQLDLPQEQLTLFVAAGRGASASFALLEWPASRSSDVIPVRLAAGASVTGRAHDGTGAAVAGATVQGTWNDPRMPSAFSRFWRAKAVSADDGSYTIDGLVPGATHLELTVVGSQAEHDLDLQAGEVGVWDPVVPAAKTWLLGLVAPDGAPLSGWMVELESSEPGFGTPAAVANERGIVTFEGLVGPPVRVSMRAPIQGTGVPGAFDPAVAGSWDGVIVGVPREFTVPADAMPTARLRGTVIGGDGMPAAGARISILRRQGSQPVVLELTTDEAGKFCYGPTVPGSLTLGVSTADGNVLRPDLQLGRGDTLDLGRLYIGAAAGVAVRLMFRLEQPTVELRLGAGQETVPLQRGEDGTWRAPAAMPAGDYVIVVRERGVIVRESPLSVEPGKDAEIELR